jgi:putative tricarboxylic transport membrane protein
MLGIDFLPIAVGLFGISEILNIAIEKYVKPVVRKVRLRELYPNRDEMKRSINPMLRGSVLGFFVGLLPGPCTVISTFVAYALEKRISRTPERFGHGAVEGVVAPESANNSAVMGSMIPLLTLGIPFAAPSATMLAGSDAQCEPGPMLFVTNLTSSDVHCHHISATHPDPQSAAGGAFADRDDPSSDPVAIISLICWSASTA